MSGSKIAAWMVIGVSFLRGILVFDMGTSAKPSDSVAGAICMAAAAIGAALVSLAPAGRQDQPSQYGQS